MRAEWKEAPEVPIYKKEINDVKSYVTGLSADQERIKERMSENASTWLKYTSENDDDSDTIHVT